MNVRIAIVVAGDAALSVAALAAFVPGSESPSEEAEAAQAPVECSTCTLRHQRLGKGKEAREREGAELRRLFEKSQQQ